MKKLSTKVYLGILGSIMALLSLSFTIAPLSQECDKLIMQNGDEIMVKIVEITATEIIYRPCNELDGINVRLPLRKAFMIKYANGGKQIFEKGSESAGRNRSRGESLLDAPGSVVSLVLGIVSIVFSFPFAFLGIFAWIYGDRAIRKYDANPELYSPSSRGMALGGKIMGMVMTILLILIALLIFVAIGLR